ncbi:terpene synthase family protein [Algoriphagus taiwanensis]
MKCFLWLFILDDIQEKLSENEFQSFIKALRISGNRRKYLGRNPFILTWIELDAELPSSFRKDWYVQWSCHWENFLNAQLWEKRNKEAKIVPDLIDYQMNRPNISGVYLSFQVLKGEHNPLAGCLSEILEHKIARWICLSNDLLSADKEIKNKDFHNELIIMALLSDGNIARSQKFLEGEQKKLHKEINLLFLEILGDCSECKSWVEGLKLLMGGCAFWSNEVTLRYDSYLNGVSYS